MTVSDPRIAALDALAWQVELGVTDCLSETPVNRFEAPQSGTLQQSIPIAQAGPAPASRPAAHPPRTKPQDGDVEDAGVRSAKEIAAAATTLGQLRDALNDFHGCNLRKGARSTVFSDGNPAARLMIVGEAPGAEEDRIGRPFVGHSGQLLDRILAAIGHDRTSDDPDKSAYITNVMPWRPPQNRDPSGDETAMMQAFLDRHIFLAKPDVVLIMGRVAASTLLRTSQGITRLRGNWTEIQGIPAMPTFHPAALLRNPIQKRFVWLDLLRTKARLTELGS